MSEKQSMRRVALFISICAGLELTSSYFALLPPRQAMAQSQAEVQELGQLSQQFQSLYARGKFQEALPVAKRAVQICRRLVGSEHLVTARCMNMVGLALFGTGDHAGARTQMEEVVRITRKSLGNQHAETATALHNLGGLLESTGNYKDARKVLDEALQIRLKVHGKGNIATAQTLGKLGTVATRQRHLNEAEAYLKQALDISRKTLGTNHRETAAAIMNLGILHRIRGNYVAARPYHEQALEINSRLLGDDHPEMAVALDSMGQLLLNMGEYRDAVSYSERAVETSRRVSGADHPANVVPLNNLASAYVAVGRFEDAKKSMLDANRIQTKVYGPDHPDTANLLNNLGTLFQRMGDYSSSEEYLKRAVDLKTRLFGDSHTETSLALYNLGKLHQTKGEFEDARALLDRALKIRTSQLGETHPHTVIAMLGVGSLLEASAKYSDARQYFEQVLKIRRSTLGNDHSDTAEALVAMGWLLEKTAEYADAQKRFEEALEINRKALGDEHPNTTAVLANLGHLFQEMGDHRAALPYYQRSLAVSRRVLGKKHPDTLKHVNNVAGVFFETGDYAAARPLYEETLEIKQETLGDHPSTITSLNNLAVLFDNMGDYESARRHTEAALQMSLDVHGEEHPQTARVHNSMGALHLSTGNNSAALKHVKQALEICEAVHGEQHPETATAQHNVGAAYRALQRFDDAESHYELALKTRRQILGNVHPDTALTLANIGSLQRDSGRFDEARSHIEESVKIVRQVYGEAHPLTASFLNNLAGLEVLVENWADAARTFEQSRRAARSHVARVLPSLSEKEQLMFLQETDRGDLHAALTLGLVRAEDEFLVGLSAGWLLNGKGVAHEALAQSALLVQQTDGPEAEQMALKLLRIRRQLARLSMTLPEDGRTESRETRLAELADEEKRLARALVELTGRSSAPVTWTEVDSVRKALPAGSYLVEFARFRPRDFSQHAKEKMWGSARYVAWVIPPEGTEGVTIVDLGEAEEIDRLIEEVRGQIEAAPAGESTLRQEGERAAVQELRGTLGVLAGHVWLPIRRHVSEADRLILSPDANLWLIPFGLLPGSAENSYLLEDFELHHVTSGRELVREPGNSRKENSPVVFANPEFDASPDRVRQSLSAIFGDSIPEDADSGRSHSRLKLLPPVNPLPGTATEAEAIKPQLVALTDDEPQSYLGRYALESVFKVVHHPRVAVLSTHGFFLPDQPVKSGSGSLGIGTRAVALTEDNRPAENPLLRCGLLLAGCNAPNAGAATGDDGILTGLEIVGVDLHGTELVVLSACETGLGKVRNGEGVSGLRQAFQLAGAESVAASLWQIPDVESARLMSDFFVNLADGQSRSEALRNAQLKRIAVRREKFGAAHPYFWAAFILTGR